jgi:hypothetical protein
MVFDPGCLLARCWPENEAARDHAGLRREETADV